MYHINLNTRWAGKCLACCLAFLATFVLSTAQAQVTLQAEAESGTLTGTQVATATGGYTGSGYVTGFNNATDRVAVTVNVAQAGSYDLAIRYAAPYGNKTNDVYVNGTLLAQQVFTQSSGFTSLPLGSITLQAGNNTLEVRHNWGWFHVDHFLVTGGPSTPPPPPATTTLQAENGTLSGVSVSTAVGGYQGSGYVTGFDNAGDQVSVSFNAPSSGNYTLKLGYRSPYGEKKQNLHVNGGFVREITFPESAGFAEVNAGTVSLSQGNNTLAIVNSWGWSDVDYFTLESSGGGGGGGGGPTGDLISIRGGQQEIFAVGINLAWKNYSQDIASLDYNYFVNTLDDLQASGANAMRWWLHTNGAYSPNFNGNGEVSGIDQQDIDNMKAVLDLAHQRGIVISMCLWSFDMLQPQGQNQQVMKNLIEDSYKTQTYIDNALIPILNQIGDHPAVMTWEIFNEPEGMSQEFGWTPMRTSMAAIQQFTNLLAGAIHRTVPSAQVSLGSWSFRAMTDVGGNYNYYRDDRLIAAGGDADGTLDFYQIHFYPEHFGNAYSPFHHEASHWGLTKPIVIGEFPVKEVAGKVSPSYSTTEAYQRSVQLGYAGALAWNYTGHDGGDYNNAREGVRWVADNYSSVVHIPAGAGSIVAQNTETLPGWPTEETTQLTVYPNPTTDGVDVEAQEPFELVVYNTNGQQVLSAQSQGNRLRADLYNEAPGMYLFYITTATNTTVQKVIKR